MSEYSESVSPSVEEQEAAYLSGLPLPDGMPEDLKEMWKERLERIKELRGF